MLSYIKTEVKFNTNNGLSRTEFCEIYMHPELQIPVSLRAWYKQGNRYNLPPNKEFDLKEIKG